MWLPSLILPSSLAPFIISLITISVTSKYRVNMNVYRVTPPALPLPFKLQTNSSISVFYVYLRILLEPQIQQIINKVICPSFSDTYSYSLALLFLLKEASKTQYWKVILSKESYVISHNFFWVKMLQTHVSCSLPLEAPPALISSLPDYYKCLLTAAQKLAVIPQDC